MNKLNISDPKFHCFYSHDKYEGGRYEGEKILEEVLQLRKQQDTGRIYELTVIYGKIVHFDPVSVVQEYKIRS